MKIIKDKISLNFIFYTEKEIFNPLVITEIENAIEAKMKLTNINCSYNGNFLPSEKVNKISIQFKGIKELIKKQFKLKKK